MNLSAMKYVDWSETPQTCKDVMADHPAPLLVRVEQGYCSEEDGDSLGQGQIIRIQKWLRQQRVIAKDLGGRHFSFPLQFPIPFEVMSEKKRTLLKRRVRTLEDITRNFTLPKTVQMKAANAKPSEYAIAAAFGDDPLELLRIHEDVYLHGNAVNYGSIDPIVINIPIHVSLELKVGQGLQHGDQTEWNKLLRDLDAIIAKESVYNTTRANQKILVYMPAKNADDSDEVLGIDVPRSVSSIDDDGPDDINQVFGDDDEADRSSTCGSASGYSVGSAEVLEDDPAYANENQNGESGAADLEEFTTYTQRTSFMLEDAGGATSSGKPPLDIDEFFKNQKGQKTDDYPEEHLFKGTVSKLSFLKPQHWANTAPDRQTGESSTQQQVPNHTPSNGISGEEKTFTKLKNLTISKHAQRIRNKMNKKTRSDKTASSKNQAKDLAPQKRLRRLSAIPSDLYSLTAQQVLDLLKLLELSEFAPAFAFDRIDGRLLSRMSADELITKYGMDEDQSAKLMAHVNPDAGAQEEEKTLTSYQITNGALDADYQQRRASTGISLTNRYF